MANGLIPITPTSISHTGTSATINANGGVDFTAVTELNLIGVFSADYDNYLILFDATCTNSLNLYYQWLSSTTPATGTDYTMQLMYANVTTLNSSRSTGLTFGRWGSILSNSYPAGQAFHIYGPFLAAPTVTRNVSADSGPRMQEFVSTHSLSTSYDGIRLFPSASDFTGTVRVFGYEE